MLVELPAVSVSVIALAVSTLTALVVPPLP